MQNPEAKSFRQLTISVEKLPARSQASTGLELSYATIRARLLLGCYRTGDANDPETYVAAISAVLARYSEAIITDVTHPVGGLPSRLTWLPTVREVFDACEAEAQRLAAHAARERRIAAQIAARDEDGEQGPRLTVEQLKAKYGDGWGIADRPRQATAPAPSWDQLTQFYQSNPGRLANLLRKDSDSIRQEAS